MMHRPKEMEMKDLDWSDVLADADRMKQEYYDSLYEELDRLDDVELEIEIYRTGIKAREGRFEFIDMHHLAVTIHLIRIGAICEGCLSRWNCDMCHPDYSALDRDAYYYNRDLEEDRLGRPLFPNEY